MDKKIYPTQLELRRLLNYDPETGVFTWKERREGDWPVGRYQKMNCATWNAQYAGKIAGTRNSSRYTIMQFGSRNLRAHRLAWIYMNGDEPFGDLDHINRNRSDNRIANLRIVDRSQNMRNYLLCKSNSSGVRGVAWNKQNFRWEAHIKNGNIEYHLGSFKDFEVAVKARYEAETKYGYTEMNPNSTAKQYLQEATQ